MYLLSENELFKSTFDIGQIKKCCIFFTLTFHVTNHILKKKKVIPDVT